MQSPRAKTSKQIRHILLELYGRSAPLPPLQQVVKDKHYSRGDYSHIRCIRCGKRFTGAGPHSQYCDHCDATMDKGLGYYSPQNWSGRAANDRRRYQLEGLLGRGRLS